MEHPIITIKEAREILGDEYSSLTDSQVEQIVKELMQLMNIILDAKLTDE